GRIAKREVRRRPPIHKPRAAPDTGSALLYIGVRQLLPPFSKGRAGEGFPDPSSTMKGTKPPPFSKGRVGEGFQTPPQHEKNETPLSLAGEGRGEGVT